ncbi:MAG: hypothetical protein LBG05_09540, partial [Treponema sp.]|nr:hypothetical protein [Treponema sp.]
MKWMSFLVYGFSAAREKKVNAVRFACVNSGGFKLYKKVIVPVLAVFVWSLAVTPVFADAGYWEAREREMRLVLSEAYYR